MKINKVVVSVVVLCLVTVGIIFFNREDDLDEKDMKQSATENAIYSPLINPADFSTNITNKYFSLPVGKKMVFEADTEEGPEKIEIEITGETKIIEGVTTLVYLDTVHLNGVIHEVTKDYLAQHKNGDVWYFGEEVDNFDEKGKLQDHAGSFIHGQDGAKAGIWMKAEQRVGDSYRQEYYKGEAEDMRDTLAVGLTVTTKLGTYTDCVKVYDWTPLDAESKEHKYYCPQVGSLVLIEHLMTGKKAELTKVTQK
jgi:hypothetical protein